MRIRYDSSSDAAYIEIGGEIGLGGVASTYMCDPREVRGMINLDFDEAGRLVGIEVMDASKRLPPGVLRTLE